MGEKIRVVFKAIDTFSEKAGGVVSLLGMVLMLIIVIKVITRYVFDIPFIWAYPLSRQVFGVFILFGGVYAMLKGAHLRVEILYNRLSPRVRFYARLLDLVLFLIFMGILIWQSGWMASNSIINTELSQGTPKIPLYIIKALIPLVAVLFLLVGISAFFRKDTDTAEK
jgi:TRAP-type mannitol/chloroaromatic compound transport system permease small subunit